jgi:predicted amidohydrolase YtcJ
MRTTLVALLLAFPATLLAQSPPDLVLVNGRVFTADSTRPWAEAVAIAGERILTVGTSTEIGALAGEATEVIDVGGRVVVPGLIDAHVHVTSWPAGTSLDLIQKPGDDPTWDEVMAEVRRAAATAEPGGWIFGTISASTLEDPHANRFTLDSIAPRHLVYLGAWSGHGLIVNTPVLERLQIPLDAADPPGGWYGRTADGKTIDGKLWEYADVAADRRLVMSMGRDSLVRAFRDVSARFLGWGITSAHLLANRATPEEMLAALREADVAVRWAVYRWPMPADDVREAYPPPVVDTDSARVRAAGAKWMLDGTLVERLAVQRVAYADRVGWYGRPNFALSEIRAILEGALAAGEQPAFHVSGDSTAALLLGAMWEIGDPTAWRQLRVRIEHGTGVHSDLIPAARDLGVVVIQNPLHFTLPELIDARFGERASHYFLLRSLVEAGIPVALGADAGGDAMNPWLNVMLAATHPNNPPEALTVEQAIVAYTRGGAIAEKREQEKGMIAAGMLADLTVLSQDVFAVPLDQLPATTSVLTIIGGEVVHGTLGP